MSRLINPITDQNAAYETNFTQKSATKLLDQDHLPSDIDVLDGNDDAIDELDDPIIDLIPSGVMPIPIDHVVYRPSQYKNILPTIFIDYPRNIKIKRVDESVITPLKGSLLRYRCKWERYCLRHTFQHNDFKKSDIHWTIAWCNHLNQDELKELNCLQKVNHFPSSWCVGRKDRLARTMNMMKRLHRDDFNFHPDTYILPMDKDNLNRRFQKTLDIKTELYIVKPVASSCGRGIKVKTQEDIMKYHLSKSSTKSLLVQKYISDPYLIDGKKFDLRIYVLVTGVDPMRVYIYQEGLTRLSTSDYSTKDIKNRFSHLTNYSINKKSETFRASSLISPSSSSAASIGQSDIDTATTITNTTYSTGNHDDDVADNNMMLSETDGYKWSLSAFRAWLSARESPEVVSNLFHKIHDLCVKTMIAAESEIASKIHSAINYRSNCFELFGCDVIIDSQLEPHLLEVNVSPSLMGSSPLDQHIKGMLIADTLHIVGIHPYDEKMIAKYDIASSTTSTPAKVNPFIFQSCSKLLMNQDRWRREPAVENVDFFILSKLADNESFWPMLLSIDDELNRARSTQFQCFHPCPSTTARYNQLYRHQRFLDHVLGYWLFHGGHRGRLKIHIPSMYQPTDTSSHDTTSTRRAQTTPASMSSSLLAASLSSMKNAWKPDLHIKTVESPASLKRPSLRQALQDTVLSARHSQSVKIKNLSDDIDRHHFNTVDASQGTSASRISTTSKASTTPKRPSTTGNQVKGSASKPFTPYKNKLRITSFIASDTARKSSTPTSIIDK